jgi:hypothetical protein
MKLRKAILSSMLSSSSMETSENEISDFLLFFKSFRYDSHGKKTSEVKRISLRKKKRLIF